MITPKIRALLFQKAKEKSGEIHPCANTTFEESYTEVRGDVYFWYNDSTGSTHCTVYEASDN
jgi:hypothetical protein